MKKNLFIIRSPLQILNAYEAIHHFNLTNNVFVLIHNNLAKNNQQMQEMLKLCKYDELIELPSKRSNYFQYVKLTHSLKKEKFKFIFFGNLGSVQKLLLANLDYEKSYMLEDGTATLKYHMLTKEKVKINFRTLRFLCAGLKVRRKKDIAFFTFFDINPIAKEEIVHHDFNHLKDKFDKEVTLKEEVYVLGQCLAEAEVVESQAYMYYIEQIKSDFKDDKIIYVPHRAEKNLEAIRDLEDENFKIIENEIPIEMYFLKHKIQPKCIVSFYSTAIFTLSKIFSSDMVKSYVIGEKDLLERRKESALMVQDVIDKLPVKKSFICFQEMAKTRMDNE